MTNYEAAPEPTTKPNHRDFAAHLRAHPGEWFYCPAALNAKRLREGAYAHFRPVGAYDARQQGGRCVVRYIGTKE